MNDDRSFERLVADNLAGIGGMPVPDGFYDDIDAYTSRQRQPRRWLALIKEPPMRTNSRLAVGSPTARVAVVMLATLLMALSLAAAGFAGQRIFASNAIVVDQSGDCDYTTITEAVAAAVDGDEILVKPGTYAESIVIDKDISLLGEDRDSVIIEFAIGCTFDEDEVVQSCPEGTPMVHRDTPSGLFAWDQPYGIQLVDTIAIVSTLTIDGHLDGLGIFAIGGAPTIDELTLAGPEMGGRMEVYDGSAATVRDSQLGGFSAEDLSPVTLTGNVIREVVVNEDNGGSSGGESLVRNNQLGWMTIGGPVTIEGNEFPRSLGSEEGPIGIYVLRGGGWVIRGNVINGRSYGIQALSDGIVEDNVIEGNDIGFQHTGPPPAMSGNRICDNRIANVRTMKSDMAPDPTTNEICPDE